MAQIMEAPRLTGDIVHSLPPGSALPVYPVDAFLKIPENWIKNSGFVVPVRSNRGLWFNWRMNSEINTAVIPTVKGCNPITGMQTTGFHLERYENKCPKHNVDFMADRFCPKCKYKWMPQNYVAAPNALWWDTWNTGDGVGRQFFFTEDELRDVATALIGKENVIPAFGFAFYSPKERRQETVVTTRSYGGGGFGLLGGLSAPGVYINQISTDNSVTAWNSGTINNTKLSDNPDGAVSYFCSSIKAISQANYEQKHDIKLTSASGCCADGMTGQLFSKGLTKSAPSSLKSMSRKKQSIKTQSFSLISDSGLDSETREDSAQQREIKEVSVGAGAQITQDLIKDPYFESWKDVPDAVMTIYFVFEEKFEELKAGGMRDFSGVPEGMLAGIPVG